jgi:hypothetical protein
VNGILDGLPCDLRSAGSVAGHSTAIVAAEWLAGAGVAFGDQAHGSKTLNLPRFIIYPSGSIGASTAVRQEYVGTGVTFFRQDGRAHLHPSGTAVICSSVSHSRRIVMDLSLHLDGTHVLITGGSGFIGSVRHRVHLPFKAADADFPSPPSPLSSLPAPAFQIWTYAPPIPIPLGGITNTFPAI